MDQHELRAAVARVREHVLEVADVGFLQPQERPCTVAAVDVHRQLHLAAAQQQVPQQVILQRQVVVA